MLAYVFTRQKISLNLDDYVIYTKTFKCKEFHPIIIKKCIYISWLSVENNEVYDIGTCLQVIRFRSIVVVYF